LLNQERRIFGGDYLEKAASIRLKEVFDALDVLPQGLTTDTKEAQAVLKKYGFNKLVEKKNNRFSYTRATFSSCNRFSGQQRLVFGTGCF